MDDRRLAVEVRTTAPDETTLQLRGDIDVAADAALTDAYARGTAEDERRIVLDFGAVDYINSTGIAIIVRLLAEARRDRREVVAVGLSDHYREIFRITRLSDFLTIEAADVASRQPEEARA